MTSMTTASSPCPDIQPPVGAAHVAQWEDVDTNTGPWRAVTFTRHQVIDSDASMSMSACQYDDGRLDEFGIFVVGDYLNSDQARELAGALLGAAAEMDRRLVGDDDGIDPAQSAV